MFRQLSDKDCAVTVVAHATGLPYTTIVNAIPEFRYKRSRRRLAHEKADQIIGRRKKIEIVYDRHGKAKPRGRAWGTVRYDDTYRVTRHPYFSNFGLADTDYMAVLSDHDILHLKSKSISLDMLRRCRLAMVSVPSLNVKNSAHMFIMRYGRIWDPSPKKRYNFMKLRNVRKISAVVICQDQAEYDHMRKVLREKLGGAEIMMMLTWKLVDMAKTLPLEQRPSVSPAEIGNWWQSGQTVPAAIETALTMEFAEPA